MSEHSQEQEAQLDEAENELGTAPSPLSQLSLEDIGGVKLSVTAELGSTQMLVRDVLELREGSVLSLHKQAGEVSDIHVNGAPIARGEVVVLGDALHVRISEILGVAEKETEQDV